MSKYILWDRYAKITFTLKNEEKIIFERVLPLNGIDMSPDFEIESNFDTTENSNTCKVTLMNLPLDMVKRLTVGVGVTVEAGYFNDGENRDVGVIYRGIIESTQGKDEGVDKKYEIICNTFNDEYKNTKINLKVGRGTKASTVIKTVLGKLDKLKTGKIELTNDVTYKDGKTLHNNVKSIFKTIAKDTDSIFFIKDGVVNFQKSNDVNLGSIEFDSNRFQSITSNQDGYTLKTVFDHRLQEGYKLKIEEKNEYENLDLKGEFSIIKGKHVMNFKGEAYSEIEIKTKLEEKENEIEIQIVSNDKTGRKKGSNKKEKTQRKNRGDK